MLLAALEPWLPTIAALLDRHEQSAGAAALELAPEARGSAGYRVPVYSDTLRPARTRMRFQDRFASFAEFRAAIDEHDPGAIVVGLELLARVAAAEVLPVALELAKLEVVRECSELARAVAHVLAASHDPAGLAMLLAKLDIYGFEFELAACTWPGGCADAHERLLELVPAWDDVELPARGSGRPRPEHVDLEPHTRMRAQMLARYLATHQHPPTLAWLRRASFHHPDGGFRQSCALSLAAWPDELERLAAAMDLDDPTLAKLGLRMALRLDPRGVIERLGGFEAAKTDPRTLDALHEVASDARERRIGRGGEGWLDAEPRWIDLAVAWSRDREGRRAAEYLFSEAPAELVTAAKAASKRKPASKRPKRPGKRQLAAHARRLAALREELERVVERLHASGYRFIASEPLAWLDADEQRALARLRAELDPLPPELELVWEKIGVVDLRGSDPSWARHAHVDHAPESRDDPWLTEPLVWLPPSASLDALDDRGELGVELPLTLDAAAAAGQSGIALSIEAPSLEFPARLRPGDRTIVELFERALAWGGFPGFAEIAERPEPWLARIRGG